VTKRQVKPQVSDGRLYYCFLGSDWAQTWRSSGTAYVPDDHKVSAPIDGGVNTEIVSPKTRVLTWRSV